MAEVCKSRWLQLLVFSLMENAQSSVENWATYFGIWVHANRTLRQTWLRKKEPWFSHALCTSEFPPLSSVYFPIKCVHSHYVRVAQSEFIFNCQCFVLLFVVVVCIFMVFCLVGLGCFFFFFFSFHFPVKFLFPNKDPFPSSAISRCFSFLGTCSFVILVCISNSNPLLP